MPKIRKSTSLKFAAVALGVAGIVGLTISSASSLNLSTNTTVQAGVTTVADCQTGPIGVSFDNTYYSSSTPGSAGYYVTKVTLTGVTTTGTPNCTGQNVKVTLTDASGTSLGEVTGTIGTTNAFAVAAGTISAAAVANTAVVIYQ